MFDRNGKARPAGARKFEDLEFATRLAAWHAGDLVHYDWVHYVLDRVVDGEKATFKQMQLLLSDDHKIHEIWLNSPWFAFDSDGGLAWFTAPSLEVLEKYTLEKLKSVDSESEKS